MNMYDWNENSLYHHGIKGQKWGVRRFQNEDGSLTEAGIRRYQSTSGNLRSKDIKSAKEELGIKKKGFLKRDYTEELLAKKYAMTKKAIAKTNKKADKQEKKGNAEKAKAGRDAVKSLEKELKAIKRDFKKYDSLSPEEKKSLIKGQKAVSASRTMWMLYAAHTNNTDLGTAAYLVSKRARKRYDEKTLKDLRGKK